MYKTNILITSAGRRVSLVNIFKHELKNVLPNSKVFTTDLNPILSPACNISDGSFQISHVSSQNYIDLLLTICDQYHVGLIIPTIDSELLILSKNRLKFENNGIKIIISETTFIETCRDKRITNSLFQKLKIKTPKEINKSYPTFPMFIKPINGSLSKGISKVMDINYWQNSYLLNEDLMFMEYLNPVEYKEYTIDSYYDKCYNLTCLVPRERIEVRGGEISKGKTVKGELYNKIKFLFKSLEGARGCITMQFFVHKTNEDLFGIEINPRFGGGYPLSYNAGANFPKNIIKEYLLDEKISFFENWIENRIMLRYDEAIYFDE